MTNTTHTAFSALALRLFQDAKDIIDNTHGADYSRKNPTLQAEVFRGLIQLWECDEILSEAYLSDTLSTNRTDANG
jgi:hypothetical protein